jgi:hypothetical protein
VLGDDFGDWAMLQHCENANRSSDARNGDVARETDFFRDSSVSEAKPGEDLEEFLRAIYEAQSRLASV